MDEKSIYCLQCYSLGATYLIPNSGVSAVTPYSMEPDDTHPFIMGYYEWQNKKIPLINFAMKKIEVHITPLSHILIIKFPFNKTLMHAGTIVEQIPRSIPIKPTDLFFTKERVEYLYPVKGTNIEANLIDLTQIGAWLHKNHIIEE